MTFDLHLFHAKNDLCSFYLLKIDYAQQGLTLFAEFLSFRLISQQ